MKIGNTRNPCRYILFFIRLSKGIFSMEYCKLLNLSKKSTIISGNTAFARSRLPVSVSEYPESPTSFVSRNCKSRYAGETQKMPSRPHPGAAFDRKSIRVFHSRFESPFYEKNKPRLINIRKIFPFVHNYIMVNGGRAVLWGVTYHPAQGMARINDSQPMHEGNDVTPVLKAGERLQ